MQTTDIPPRWLPALVSEHYHTMFDFQQPLLAGVSWVLGTMMKSPASRQSRDYSQLQGQELTLQFVAQTMPENVQ